MSKSTTPLAATDVTVLVADRDPYVGERLRESLSVLGYDVDVATDVADLKTKLGRRRYAVMLLDEGLIADEDEAFHLRLALHHPELGTVLTSSLPTVNNVVSALRARARDYLVKPFDLREITQAIDRSLRNRQATDKPRQTSP